MKNTNIMADTNSTTGHKSDNECGKYTSLAMENCWAVKATKTVKYLGVLIEGRRRVFCSESKPYGLKRWFICCCGVHMFEYDNVETARLFTSKLDNMKSSMALAIDLVNKGEKKKDWLMDWVRITWLGKKVRDFIQCFGHEGVPIDVRDAVDEWHTCLHMQAINWPEYPTMEVDAPLYPQQLTQAW